MTCVLCSTHYTTCSFVLGFWQRECERPSVPEFVWNSHVWSSVALLHLLGVGKSSGQLLHVDGYLGTCKGILFPVASFN